MLLQMPQAGQFNRRSERDSFYPKHPTIVQLKVEYDTSTHDFFFGGLSCCFLLLSIQLCICRTKIQYIITRYPWHSLTVFIKFQTLREVFEFKANRVILYWHRDALTKTKKMLTQRPQTGVHDCHDWLQLPPQKPDKWILLCFTYPVSSISPSSVCLPLAGTFHDFSFFSAWAKLQNNAETNELMATSIVESVEVRVGKVPW